MSTDTNDKLAIIAERATAALAEITDEASFKRWVATAKRFHTYSFMNQILIWCQRPEATRVAGFSKWLELKRCVRKGEKGIAIYAPMKFKPKGEDEQDLESYVRFRIVYVFDIEQTEGEELPAGPTPIPMDDSDFDPTALHTTLTDWLAGEGIDLIIEPFDSTYNGYYSPGRKLIALNGTLSKPQAFKTLIHEAAHYVAQHRGQSAQEAEIVAETAAYLTASYIGFDTSSYSLPYIAHWAKELEPFKIHLTTAHSIAQQLTRVLAPKDATP